MKSALIASSMAALAYGFPDLRAHVESRMKTHMKEIQNKPHAKSIGDFSTEAVKDEVEIEYHKANLEVAFGPSCSDLTVQKSGYQTEICVNMIEGESEDIGFTGESFSWKIVRGSGGFPQVQYHYGHQCRYYLGEYPFIDPMEMGFPFDYQIGSCHTFTDPGTGAPMYYGKISWSPIMTDPQYPYVRQAYTNKARNCDKNSKFYLYHVERTDTAMCFDSEDDDGTPTYYSWDATNCTNGVMHQKYYLDPGCSTYSHTHDYYPRDCDFDISYFLESIEEGDSPVIDYVFQDCGGSPP
jgi:hypothetical protein